MILVKALNKKSKEYFQCEECLMYYLDSGIADECERWCKKHKSCNTDIINKSVKL